MACMFQSTPHDRSWGDQLTFTGRRRGSCFNPLPMIAHGETTTLLTDRAARPYYCVSANQSSLSPRYRIQLSKND